MDERLEKYVQGLSLLVNIPTVSDADTAGEETFLCFRHTLKELFPRVFGTFTCEEFHGSLLLSHKGTNGADPVLFMSHHDVVSGNGEWMHEPFAAEVDGGKLYGRGTLDTKGNLFAVLTAFEELLEEDFPLGSVYIESSCNEETTGAGAFEISRELKKRGIRFAFTMDEGGMIVYDPIGGADGYFAMVAVGEKDCVDLKFTARSAGGHASTPGGNEPLSRLARFIVDAEKHTGFRPRLDSVTVEMLRRFSARMRGAPGFFFRHAGLFRHLLARVFPKFSPTANATVRTTLCFTEAKGSDECNVIPAEAYVTGNLRISHHDEKEKVFAKLRRIAAKYGVETEIVDAGNRSGVCDHKTAAFAFLAATVSENFPGVLTVPYISTGASDSRFFTDLSENVFRFAPFRVTDEQLDAMHGKDENIDVSTLIPAVDFYKNLIRKL